MQEGGKRKTLGYQAGLEIRIRAVMPALKEFTANMAFIAQTLVEQLEFLPQAAEEKAAYYWGA